MIPLVVCEKCGEQAQDEQEEDQYKTLFDEDGEVFAQLCPDCMDKLESFLDEGQ
jgi:hypothetical protein